MAHDPTTRSLVILAATIAVLLAGTVRPAVAKPDRCCVADRCRRASATRCAKLGGMDIGQGSCQPNPCAAACGPDCSSGTCPAAGQACVFDCTTSCGCRDCSAANCSCTAGFCSSSADCPSGYSCVPNPCSIPIGSGRSALVPLVRAPVSARLQEVAFSREDNGSDDGGLTISPTRRSRAAHWRRRRNARTCSCAILVK